MLRSSARGGSRRLLCPLGHPPSHPIELVRIRDGLVVLAMIDDHPPAARKVEAALEGEGRDASALMKAREAKLIAVYQALKECPIYQA
jgi:hypothetical protein